MVKKSLFLLIWHFIFAVSAANVSLSGSVKDSNGTAVTDATVSLIKNPLLTTTTDAQGSFALTGDITGIAKPLAIRFEKLFVFGFSGKFMQFWIINPAKNGSISIFSSSGRRSVHIQMENLHAGINHQVIPQLPAGFYFLRVAIDQYSTTRKMVSTGNDLYLSNTDIGVQKSSGFSKKALTAAVIDTLLIIS